MTGQEATRRELEKIRRELEALRYSQAGKYERAAIRRDRERELERRRRA